MAKQDNFKVLFTIILKEFHQVRSKSNMPNCFVKLIVEHFVCNAPYLEILQLVSCQYLTLVIASKLSSHKMKVFLISRLFFTVSIKISIFQVKLSCENSV